MRFFVLMCAIALSACDSSGPEMSADVPTANLEAPRCIRIVDDAGDERYYISNGNGGWNEISSCPR